MKLCLDIVCNSLETRYALERFGHADGRLTLPGPMLYCQGERLLSDNLYIAEAAHLPPEPVMDFPTLICIGTPAAVYFERGIALAVVDKSTSLATLFNDVQTIYNSFDKWDQSLRSSLNQSLSVHSIFEISRDVFGNPLAFMDSTFHLVIDLDPEQRVIKLSDLQPVDEFGSLPLDLVQYFMNDPFYNEIETQTTAFIYPASIIPCRTLCINIFPHGKFAGRITVAELDRLIRSEDFALLEHMAQYVQLVFELLSSNQQETTDRLADMLKRILDGNALPVNLLVDRFPAMNWQEGDQFLWLRIVPTTRNMNSMRMFYLCRQIERIYAHSCVFEYNGGLAALIDLTVLSSDIDEFVSNFSIFLREGNLKAGNSYAFSNISQLHVHYRQASTALEIGSIIDPMIWNYRFEDYVLPYIFNKLSEDFPTESLCPKGLLLLIEHDRQFETKYCDTLRVYLQHNMNAVHTAKSLYIHRATLLYRLERIRKISGLDWNNPNVFLHLQIFFRIYGGSTKANTQGLQDSPHKI